MEQETTSLMILIVGSFVALSFLSRMFLKKIHVPAFIGYITMGLVVKWLDTHYHFLDGQITHPLKFLAEAGIILLLFEVGLKSNIKSLIDQLPRASWIWFCNVVVSGYVGFAAAFYLLDINLIPSLFVATALTATSIGVSVALLKEEKILDSKRGQLILDVAELDDLSSIAILALLLSILPVLIGNGEEISAVMIGKTIAMFAFTFIAFALFCTFFSLKIEPCLSKFISTKKSNQGPMMVILSISFIIAAFAELLGLSLAIGAFFAGLAFSRDPKMVKCEMCYKPLHDFFVPFFFIGIGLHIDPTFLGTFFGIGLVLLVAAILGKVIGTGGAAIPYAGFFGAAVIAVSMVPRAEIAMIVMQKGLALGDAVMPQNIFSAMVVVVAGTTFLTPFALKWVVKFDKGRN